MKTIIQLLIKNIKLFDDNCHKCISQNEYGLSTGVSRASEDWGGGLFKS
jgi:hypothetical protein